MDNMRDFVEKNTIFMTLAGSHMYGMATPQSDIDKRGVCIPPKNVVMGFARKFEQQEVPGEDTVIFGLTKFLKLASECNPNVIELLFAPEKCILTNSPTWERIRARRHDFLSAEAFKKFNGYAMGQLKRIRSHRNWLLNPPKEKPVRADFGLKDAPSGLRELATGIDISEISPETLRIIQLEKNYKSELLKWNQYETWKTQRNVARAALEADHGYDTKHASHLVRLLRMGKEVLTKGDLTVRRPDADELLAIRRGKWSYDELMENVEPLQQELREIYEEKKYVVKDKVDRESISDFCVELHEEYWNGV